MIREGFGRESAARVRLVRGSHIVTRRLFEHDRAYIFQQADGRIVFAIPYEGDFTLIGTTDLDHDGAAGGGALHRGGARLPARAPSRAISARRSGSTDIVWSYSGVRPLYDDGASSATAATRDYVLGAAPATEGAAAVDVFGGKITTYRRLPRRRWRSSRPFFPGMGGPWTARRAAAGRRLSASDGAAALARELVARFPFLDAAWAGRLVRAYGTEAAAMLGRRAHGGGSRAAFGWNLTEREVRWLIEREWARSAEDVLWRRTKLGLRLDAGEAARLEAWMAGARSELRARRGLTRAAALRWAQRIPSRQQ